MSGYALVTGGTGFAGSHLIDHLLEFDDPVAAWSNPGGRPVGSPDPRVRWRAVDLLDREAVTAALAEIEPAAIYHCAGVATVGGSWTRPTTALRVNAVGTHHVLDAVRRLGLGCAVVVAGSALVYRPSAETLDETSPIGPSSPYALSKLAQEMAAARATWCPTHIARSFNHAGPRQSTDYVTSAFARQIAEIEAGLRPAVLQTGNLEARRDITDVRDVVRAYRMLIERGHPGRPYNICSGRARRVGDLLDQLLGRASLPIRVEPDPSRMRPADTPVVVGDPSRIMAETGWRPLIPIDRTLADLLDYWRERTAAGR